MSPQGGMLKEILKPFKFFIAPVFGNGNQWQSWISINDFELVTVERIFA